MKYTYDGSIYRLIDGEDCLLESFLVALSLSFDGEHSVLHKHGPADSVRAWYDQACRRFKEVGVDLYFLTGPIPVSAINRMIDTSGWTSLFIRDSGLGEAMRDHPTSRVFEYIDHDGWTGWTAGDPAGPTHTTRLEEIRGGKWNL